MRAYGVLVEIVVRISAPRAAWSVFLIDCSISGGRVFRERVCAVVGECAIGMVLLGILVREKAAAFVNMGEFDLRLCEGLHICVTLSHTIVQALLLTEPTLWLTYTFKSRSVFQRCGGFQQGSHRALRQMMVIISV